VAKVGKGGEKAKGKKGRGGEKGKGGEEGEMKIETLRELRNP